MILILQKEYLQRVTKKTFILTTILTPVLLILLSLAPMLVMLLTKDNIGEITNVAVIDNSNKIAFQLKNSDRVTFDPIQLDGLEEVKNNKSYNAYLYINSDVITNYKDIKLESLKELNLKTISEISGNLNEIIRELKITEYEIENLPDIVKDLNVQTSLKTMIITEDGEMKESSSSLNYATGLIGGFLIYFFIFIYGSMVLNSIVDEKSSKVVEIMVSTVSPMQMMMGKIIGIGLVAITQFFIWACIIFFGGVALLSLFAEHLSVGDASTMMAMSGGMPVGNVVPSEVLMTLNSITNIYIVLKTIGLFAIFFIGGYLFYAACFAAVASAVDNLQDVQQLQTPITVPIIASLIFLSFAIEEPNSSLAFWLSIIPFTSPIIMMGRISGSVPIWDIILSIVALYTSFIGMLWCAGRIYRVGIFMHGKKPSFKDLYKWIKYK